MTYPTISHLIESITGIFIPLPIQTFGFFIVTAFIVGHYFIKKEFLRFEELKIFQPIVFKNSKSIFFKFIEYIINCLLAFFLGYKLPYIIQNYQFFAESPHIIILSSEGNILFGFILSLITLIFMYRNNENKYDTEKNVKIYPSDLSWNILFIAAGSGIIGAKLFAVLEDVDYLIQDPVSAILSFSGLTFYGGLIVGTLCVIIYAKKYKINILKLADAFAPSLILAYGIGRLGCHFSGDGDWGIIANMNKKPEFLPDWIWGYKFPHNVIEAGVKINDCIGKYCYELPHPVHPTSLYEALFGFFAFVFLWQMRKNIKIPGILFCIYLIINGVERYLIEIIRVTEKYAFFNTQLTQAQIIGISLIIIGLLGIILLTKLKKQYDFIKK
ncbi:MAG: diacylglyceryl transferase [Flavobacteriales bacterium]|nr:diacylglyceryl transferase [Flavobacteriales bacterium]